MPKKTNENQKKIGSHKARIEIRQERKKIVELQHEILSICEKIEQDSMILNTYICVC
jgi:hypothetical protein